MYKQIKTMTNEEIIREIRYLVDSEPNDQTLGNKIRHYIDNVDEEVDVEVYDGLRTWQGINHVPTIEELQAQDNELKNLINSYYGRNNK